MSDIERAFHIGVARLLGPWCLVLGPSSGPRSLVHGAAGATFAERQRIGARKTLVDQGRRTKDGSYSETKAALAAHRPTTVDRLGRVGGYLKVGAVVIRIVAVRILPVLGHELNDLQRAHL